MPTKADALQLCYAMMSRCQIIDPEPLVKTYSVDRIIKVPAYGLLKHKWREIKAPNPSSLILTVLRQQSEVPDVRNEVLKDFVKPVHSTADVVADLAESKKMIEAYLSKGGACC